MAVTSLDLLFIESKLRPLFKK